MKNALNKFTDFIREIRPSNKIGLSKFRKKNNNHTFTLLSRNCVAGIVYHQLGEKFYSPTINMLFTPKDFNLFCLNLKDYVEAELVEDTKIDEKIPAGLLTPKKGQPIRIVFNHYKSFEDAAKKWNERKARINWDDIYVVSVFSDPFNIKDLSDEFIKEWNSIPYKKVMLVDKKYGFDDEFVLKKPKHYNSVWYFRNHGLSWKRTFNQFDFIKFLNDK